MVKWSIWIISLFLIGSVLWISFSVNGESGSVDVPADETRTVSLGNLITGTVLKYSFTTDDNGDKLNFKITDGSNDYEQATRVYGKTGTFTVPSTATYQFHWFCDNWMDTANIEYSYTITLPDPNADLFVSYIFSENPCHQGNSTEFNVIVKNEWDDQIKITEVGVHFDFLPENIYFVKENLDDILATNQQIGYTFDVEINTDVSLGMHMYDVYIVYDGRLSGEWVPDTWTSGNQLDFNVIEIDRDFDGYPDSQDTFPDNPNEWKDTDSDGVGDNSDKFKNDPAASVDSDGDGYPDNWNLGKTIIDSTTGLTIDVFPNNSTEWDDSDNDSIGDNTDAFPDDPAASVDTDGDGYPDQWNTGMSKKDSATGLKIDDYPLDVTKWEKKEPINFIPIAIGVCVVGLILVIILILIIVIIIKSIKGKKDSAAEKQPLHQPPKPAAQSMGTKFNSCPYCGKTLNFPTTPNYCPFCNNQLIK